MLHILQAPPPQITGRGFSSVRSCHTYMQTYFRLFCWCKRIPTLFMTPHPRDPWNFCG